METDLQAGANHRFEVNQIEKKMELAISQKIMKRESAFNNSVDIL